MTGKSKSSRARSMASPRILAAIALLDPRPAEKLLEIGCGTGQAIRTVLDRCPTARVVAIDRSDKAVARARIVNSSAVGTGQVNISVSDIERAPVEPGGFDRAFAIRVNSFWTRPGVALPHVAASLRSGGELWIVYDGPSDKVITPIVESLHKFGVRQVRTQSATGAFAIIGQWLDHPGS